MALAAPEVGTVALDQFTVVLKLPVVPVSGCKKEYVVWAFAELAAPATNANDKAHRSAEVIHVFEIIEQP